MQNAPTFATSHFDQRFEELHAAHAASVRKSVLRRGVPSPHADDVVQDIFVAVYANLPTFSGESPIGHWIHGITRNVVAMYFRARAQRSDTISVADEQDFPCGSETPDTHMERRLALELLSRALSRMTPMQREVYWLYEIEELPAPEVARRLGLRENTVRMRMRAARRHLSNVLEEPLDDAHDTACA